MKKTRLFSILLALVLLLALPFGNAGAAGFKDVDNNYWAANEINRLAEKGILAGYEDNTFKPENHVTRAQAAIILSRLLNLDTSKESSIEYKDVSKDFYAYGAIAAVTNADIMKGSNGEFKPDADLTRAQMAIIIANAFNLKGDGTTSFTDVPKDFYAYEAIDALRTNGITTGSNNAYNPNDSITRAQFAVFLSRILDNQSKDEVNPLVEELKQIYNNESHLDSYDFEGTMNFGIEFPVFEGMTEEDAAIFDMFKDISADFKGVYQKDPLMLEMVMTMKMNGMTMEMPAIMTADKMYIQLPEVPGEETPDELKGKFMEMDFNELAGLSGQPVPDFDLELNQKLNAALYDIYFKHFGSDYYKQVPKNAVSVPSQYEVEKVLKFEVTNAELTPFVQKLVYNFIPEFFALLENPEYAKAFGITADDVKAVKELLNDPELKAFIENIGSYVTLNNFKEYIAVHPDKYISYDVFDFNAKVAMEGQTYGLKMNYKMGKSNVNGTPNFTIGIPSEENIIKFEELYNLEDLNIEGDLVEEEATK